MTEKAYFLSDIHLRFQVDDVERERRRELFKLLDQIKEEGATLFIVGDWFDFYFEYGSVVTQSYFDVYSKMHELAEAGINIHYFAGNHDYWLGDFMKHAVGVKTYLHDQIIEFGGKRIYFHHGDGLDATDVGYQRLKAVIRHPFFIWFFKWLVHPNIGHWLARKASRHSRKTYSGETPEYLLNEIRKNYALAEDKFAEGVDYMITGHIHFPKLKMFGKNCFLTIGDFIKYFSYGYFDGLNLSLKQWPVKQLEQRELP
ncbi:MAG: UDP-2,3-diacylglucosamine diphosphatase [Candidatus Marinimicrobia bacterium]|nr:UDP-2,3-diacylglucosamine diphosphatase [Candidatus Neomarinimicrobiota bacterium]